jgi:quercetin dioxygenase-like cupin family protein
MRRSTISVLVAFAMGACTTAAVQTAAAPAPAEAVAWSPPISEVLTRAADAQRRHPPGKPEVSVTVLARGEKAFLARLQMPAGAAVPQHRDSTEEYIHVLEGGGTITVDGTAHTIATGDTVYMPAGAEVSFTNGDAPLVAMQVFAGPEPASKYGVWQVAP